MNKIFFCIQIGLFTFMIFLYPFFDFEGETGTYNFMLKCTHDLVYPTRFLYIWMSDFICAFLSIFVIMYEKRFVSDKGRLRLARKMDIENLTNDIVKKQKELKKSIKSSDVNSSDLGE